MSLNLSLLPTWYKPRFKSEDVDCETLLPVFPVQVYPMAVVATAERGLIVYQLENQPSEFRRIDSPLTHQVNDSTHISLSLSFNSKKLSVYL